MDIRLHISSDTDVRSGVADDGEIDISTGGLVMVDGPEAIAQHLRIRLRFFFGEWFLDPEVGIPYFEDILVKNPNTNVVTSIFREAILGTPGVLSIETLALNFDRVNRKLTVTFTAKVSGSDVPLEFIETLVLL